jgi:hypothetical protein
MASGVGELIEMLYNMVSDAWGLPLGAEKCVIERDKVLDLLDEIKAQLPTELAEAKRLVNARAEFIANAKKEADTIKKSRRRTCPAARGRAGDSKNCKGEGQRDHFNSGI